MHVSIGNLNSPRQKKKLLLVPNQNVIATCFQSVKYRLTVSNLYSQQFPLVVVYGGWDSKIENWKGDFEITAKRIGHPTKRRTGSAPDTKRRTSTFQSAKVY